MGSGGLGGLALLFSFNFDKSFLGLVFKIVIASIIVA